MIRRGVLLALLLALCACGPSDDRAPFTDSRIPPSLGPADWPPQGWAWGLIQVGENPPQRYGVGAPMDEPAMAQVLALPGYGGAAEDYFGAANVLIAQRIQVWTLDGVGQGGSGRLALPRDLGHVDSFQGDVAGLQQMVTSVVRPAPDAPLIAIADGLAAPVLLRGLQQGLPDVAAVVLTQPRLSAPSHAPLRPRLAQSARWARWLHYGRYRAPGESGWRREGTNEATGSPAFVRHAWQVANPDLRMGGPSLGWFAAFDELIAAVRAEGWRNLQLPVLMLSDPAASATERRTQAALCRALPRCTLALIRQDRWPAAEGAFVDRIVAQAANPLEASSLPNPRPGR